MHTFIHEGTVFNFNSDLSGDVRIVEPGRVEKFVNGPALQAFARELMAREYQGHLDEKADRTR